jgi:hypothetical protein
MMKRGGRAAAIAVLCCASSAHAQPEPEPERQPAAEPEPASEPTPPAPPPAATDADSPVTPVVTAAAATEEKKPLVELGGYFTPGFGFRHRPDATPADGWEHGFFAEAGLVVTAQPFESWTGTLEVAFDPESFEAATDVELFDLVGDQSDLGLRISTEKVPGISLEEATVDFTPWPFFGIEAGVLRIPFSVEQQIANTELMFPNRAPPNEAFQSGADIGALVHTSLLEGVVEGSFGVFNGSSLGFGGVQDVVARGVVLALRADVNPFGAFPFVEGDTEVGPFRLGIGWGGMYRPATLYDEETGQERTAITDLRMAASLRMAVRGFYVAVEYLRRQQTDELSSRPEINDGAFAQASFFFRVTDGFGLEPIARLGFIADDESFDTRLTGWIDAGLSLYPRADAEEPDRLRLSVQYLGERHFTEGEEAHGLATSVRLQF